MNQVDQILEQQGQTHILVGGRSFRAFTIRDFVQKDIDSAIRLLTPNMYGSAAVIKKKKQVKLQVCRWVGTAQSTRVRANLYIF